jgi:uncharacterized protein
MLRPEVGAAMDLAIDEENQVLGDLKVDYVRGKLRLTRTDKRILAKGTLDTSVQAECVRCLITFQLPLTLQFEEMFAFSPSADPVYFVDEGGWLDLRQPVREQILLAMPIQTLCRPVCKGLCSQCGANLNEGPCGCGSEDVDPRLAGLKSLLK